MLAESSPEQAESRFENKKYALCAVVLDKCIEYGK